MPILLVSVLGTSSTSIPTASLIGVDNPFIPGRVGFTDSLERLASTAVVRIVVVTLTDTGKSIIDEVFTLTGLNLSTDLRPFKTTSTQNNQTSISRRLSIHNLKSAVASENRNIRIFMVAIWVPIHASCLGGELGLV